MEEYNYIFLLIPSRLPLKKKKNNLWKKKKIDN